MEVAVGYRRPRRCRKAPPRSLGRQRRRVAGRPTHPPHAAHEHRGRDRHGDQVGAASLQRHAQRGLQRVEDVVHDVAGDRRQRAAGEPRRCIPGTARARTRTRCARARGRSAGRRTPRWSSPPRRGATSARAGATACSRGRRPLPRVLAISPRTTTAPNRSGPAVPSSRRRMRTSVGLSPSPITIVSDSSAWPSASTPSTITASVAPVSQPGSKRRRAGVSGRTTSTSVRTSPVAVPRPTGHQPRQRVQKCRLRHVRVHRVQRLHRDLGRGEDAADGCGVGREDVPGTAGALVHAIGGAVALSRAARDGVRSARTPGPAGRSWPRRTGGRRSAGRADGPSAESPHGTASTGSPRPLNGRVSRENRPIRRTVSSTAPAVTAASSGGGSGMAGAKIASTSPNTSSTNSRASRARKRPACR